MSTLIVLAVELVTPASISYHGTLGHSRVFVSWLLIIAIDLLAAVTSKTQLPGLCHVLCLHVRCNVSFDAIKQPVSIEVCLKLHNIMACIQGVSSCKGLACSDNPPSRADLLMVCRRFMVSQIWEEML